MAHAHLVGSLRLGSAEEVFRLVSAECGDSVSRIPDGETGPRAGWTTSLIPRLRATPGLEVVGELDIGYTAFPLFGLRAGWAPADVGFDLGYDTDGIAAWPTFSRLKQDGAIGQATKFQVAIPTPMAVVGYYVQPEDRAALMQPYEDRLRVEIENITRIVPPDELAIQWDVAVEIALLEGAFGPQPLPDEVILDEIVRLSTLVPEGVELGYHLCYGNAPTAPGAKGRHFKEPDDTALLTRVANAISAGSARDVNWIHMPVPITRDDDDYFAPLSGLDLRPETELFLGLLHKADGLEGAQRRATVAARHSSRPFGVATECGMGTEPEADMQVLLRLHREVQVPA
jgi:hypothetical protein